MNKHRLRLRKLVEPRIQLRITGWFIATTIVSLLFQWIFVTSSMSALAVELTQGAAAFPRFEAAYREILFKSVFVVLPLVTVVGVLATFRIAGPIHRIRVHLQELRDRTASQPCSLRRGDELQDVVALLNTVTEPLRRDASANGGPDGSDERRERPAA